MFRFQRFYADHALRRVSAVVNGPASIRCSNSCCVQMWQQAAATPCSLVALRYFHAAQLLRNTTSHHSQHHRHETQDDLHPHSNATPQHHRQTASHHAKRVAHHDEEEEVEEAAASQAESKSTSHRHHSAASTSHHSAKDSHHKHHSESSAASSTSSDGDIVVLDRNEKPVPVTRVLSFSAMPAEVPPWLQSGLQKLAFPSTTDIQSVTIPPLLEGRDIIGLAPTGSGKTVAFAVPALVNFERSPDHSPTVLVLAPTRELVQQTARVFQQLGDGYLRVGEAYGGAPREIQARRFHKGCDVLIACPGRLKDFLENRMVSLDHLRFLVFDEADRLLDMGFKIQLDDIMSFVDPAAPRQSMMWSATWPQSVQRLASEYLKDDRYTIRAGTQGKGAQVNERIRQHVFVCDDNHEKVEQLAQWCESGKIKEDGCKMIIFVERQTDTEQAASLIVRRLGIRSRSVGVLHGGMAQNKRDYVMNDFKQNRIRILVATDVASRGLDFPDVTVVVNFFAPKDIDSYCHRIGRTGRAGRHGDAFTFLSSTSSGSLAKDLVPYLRRCKMDVPEDVEKIAKSFESYGNFNRRNGGGFRQGNFNRRGGGGGGYSHRQPRDDGFGGHSSGGSHHGRQRGRQHHGEDHRASHHRARAERSDAFDGLDM
mmetsp:Transcript_49068/g.56516  ORF Transcript_49068/g.56516 Transcript_49068/m.56516 type:complete len:652 (+) Transcript_49068:25-1980(+)